ncbi:MAG: hypothetical protein AB7G47_11455 [Mycolicibacterium sp.]|uniref:hypothetical protein n=1 Tax=Mycolicibacterium sp. TaxID=2320850 RepID=UPI003D1201E3
MDLLITVAVVAVALGFAALLLSWSLRRRAAFRSALEQRGWQLSRHGETTTVVPAAGDWTVTMTRSYAAQMSPPSTRIVTTVWTASTPAAPGAALVAGPAPPAQLRGLAADLVGSATAAMTGWLGLDRVTGGLPLRAVPSADDRLLVFATQGYGPPGALTGLADAVSAWCEKHPAEREHPVVSINEAGICVRVRVDALRSVEQLEAFVDLGMRCRADIDRSRS